jgi:hemerythrin-like domain-containing protein
MPRKKHLDAFALLKDDHQKAKRLFDEFEDADSGDEMKRVAELAIRELKIHSAVEEEIFYPTVRAAINDEDCLMEEAAEEHHVAKMLIAELEKREAIDEVFGAKFMVLAENVRHHIKEEENRIFPEARQTPVDFDALATQMQQRKEQLMKEGVPESAEEALLSHAR